MEFAIGALEYGLIAAPKHYAFNDQESERGGVSPYMTEQRAREIELRAYQIAFEATKDVYQRQLPTCGTASKTPTCTPVLSACCRTASRWTQ